MTNKMREGERKGRRRRERKKKPKSCFTLKNPQKMIYPRLKLSKYLKSSGFDFVKYYRAKRQLEKERRQRVISTL